MHKRNCDKKINKIKIAESVHFILCLSSYLLYQFSSFVQLKKENIIAFFLIISSVKLSITIILIRLEAEARLAAEKEAMRQAEERASEILRRRDKESKDSPRTTPNRSSSSNTPSRSSSSTPVSFSTSRKKQSDEVSLIF